MRFDKIDYFLIKNDYYFERDNGLYGYYDDGERYAFFSLAVIELMKYRDDIRIDVIALAIGDHAANNQLKCVSLVTSGKFYTANTAAELLNSLNNSVSSKKEVDAKIISNY